MQILVHALRISVAAGWLAEKWLYEADALRTVVLFLNDQAHAPAGILPGPCRCTYRAAR